MTNNELLKKMSQDMEMRNFSSYTYDFYLRKTKEMIRYFDKPMEEVIIEEHSYKFKTIFMLVCGSGLRIGEVTNLHISDIDSKNRRIFVREGKGNKERSN